ncbi:hypothetical protein HPB48_006643 [Haemaphysalis longicornis]|uniref:Sulfotransferase domain-containing protein n=1 Tax=Haemaphysalis longicornis TaxID=44386 RepID=A0A9J6GTA7_HAELO|nr:hypothetical protein HPB48_006643 [Haemaphysalis longicornis]
MTARRPYRQMIDGELVCPWLDPATYRKNRFFRAADGDLMQSTHPKCGTHVVQYITQLILKGGDRIETYSDFTSNTRVVEYMQSGDWTPTLPVRTLYTHRPLFRETMNPAAKYVFVARNPWDCCVSQFQMITNMSVYRFQDATFEEFVDAFLAGEVGYGSYFDHMSLGYDLKDEPNVFFMTYEELLKDKRGMVLKLAHFIGEKYGKALEDDEEKLENVLKWSKPEHMRKVIVFDFKRNDDLGSEGWDDLFERTRVTCKHGYEGDETKYALVQKCKVGGWKELFTPALLARFEKKIQDEGDNAAFMELWQDMREEAKAICRNSS